MFEPSEDPWAFARDGMKKRKRAFEPWPVCYSNNTTGIWPGVPMASLSLALAWSAASSFSWPDYVLTCSSAGACQIGSPAGGAE